MGDNASFQVLNISDILPPNRLTINIEIDDDFNRIVTIGYESKNEASASEYKKIIEEIEL